jgi:hypothetical protein
MGSKTIKQIGRELTVISGLTEHHLEGEDLVGSYKVNLDILKNTINSGITDDIINLSTTVSTSISNEVYTRYSTDMSLSTAISSVSGAIVYKGTWDARTVGEGGTGDIPVSGVGFFYIVSMSGSTVLTGRTGMISEWGVGDWAVHDGTYWDKIDNTEADMTAENVTYSNPLISTVSNVQEALDSGITYMTKLTPLSMTVKTGGVGGIPDTTTVGDLSGKTFTQLFDSLLFPTQLAYLGTPVKSLSLTGVTTSTIEVGTPYTSLGTLAVFNQGTIRNGDGSLNPNGLVGLAYSYSFFLPGPSLDYTYNVVTNSQAHTFSSYNIVFGTNTWSVQSFYSGGTGAYYDNKGNSGTNLDPQRVSGSISSNSNTITGRRRYWWGVGTAGSAPTDSAGVRTLTNTGFLSSTNTGTFDISIPTGTRGVWFFIPAGKTISVINVYELSADVTATFLPAGSISVNDAGGTPQSYSSYVTDIGGVGYPIPEIYRVTIT